MASVQADPLVNAFGVLVLPLDIEAQSADIFPRHGQLANMGMEGFKDSFPAEGFLDINTLNPPEIPVPPIAPFKCDQELANDPAAGLREKVKTLRRVPQDRADTVEQPNGIESATFRFLRQLLIELRDDGSIAQSGLSNDDIDGADSKARPETESIL
jgi:hypothetical protein